MLEYFPLILRCRGSAVCTGPWNGLAVVNIRAWNELHGVVDRHLGIGHFHEADVARGVVEVIDIVIVVQLLVVDGAKEGKVAAQPLQEVLHTNIFSDQIELLLFLRFFPP
jgi:hypothetical protein